MTMRLDRGMTLPAMVLAIALSTPAMAEESASLEEIIVTAQKRSENIQEVPISVTAVSSSEIERLRLAGITEIAATIPNMVIQTPFAESQPVFSIRGVSASDFSQNNASPIGVYVDEVYKGILALQSLQIFDLDRIEVLRGPQGTLFGRNTTGGAVSFYTKGPALDGVHGYLSGGLGNYERREVSGALEGSAVDNTVGLRAAFTYAETDGYAKNLFPGVADKSNVDDWGFRISGRWRPNDSLDVGLTYARTRSNPHGYGGVLDDLPPGGVLDALGYSRAGLDFFEIESDRAGELDIQNETISLRAVWDLSDTISLTSVTSWDEGSFLNEADDDATPFNINHNDSFTDVTTFGEDLRLSSASQAALQWTAGLNVYREELDTFLILRNLYVFAGDADGNGQLDCFDDFFTGCRYSNRIGQTRTAFAGYVDASWQLVENLKFIAGLRYTHDRIEIDYYEAFLGFFDPATNLEAEAFQTILGAPEPRTTDELWTGRAGLQYQLSDDAMAYFTYSRGARSASYNGSAFFSPEEVTIAAPETIDAFELGFKSDWLGNRLRANGALFYYDWRNQQVIDVELPAGLFVLRNADKVRNVGAELELTAVPSDQFQLQVSIGYLNAEYQDFVLQGVDLSGNTAIASPEWTMSLAADWRVIETSLGNLSAHVDTRFTDRQFYDATQTASVSQPGYWVHNARLTFATPDQRLSFSAWIRNLANEEYKLYEFPFYFADLIQPGRPRTYGLEAKYSF